MHPFVPTASGRTKRRWARTPSHFALGLITLLGAAALCGCTSGSSSPRAASSAVGCDATSVADKDLPSVVTITASGTAGPTTGSGEIIRDNGSVLTNNHVVAPAASGGTLSVLLSDGRSYPATLVGRDPQTDLAVVKIDTGSSLAAISVGSSSTVQIGEPVVALGAPLGLSNTLTTGIVSALNRTVEVPSDNGKTATLIAALQTDAAINPGNSGGALTNCAGALIGVPTANATVTAATGQTSTGNVGIGFAIPVDLAIGVADQLIANGQVTHSYFGIDVIPVAPAAAKQAATQEGLYVTSVAPGGPAANAGLQQGDVVTKVDGQPATDPLQLALLTLKKKPGDAVTITFDRSGTTMQATVTLGSPP